MEQLQQLIGIRDAAERRLEDARAALERSPDAKLVASLSLLIDDLRKSFETEGNAGEMAASAPAYVAPVQEAPVEADTFVQYGENTAEAAPESVEATASRDDFSLEDSLEAELMAVDKNS